MGLESDTDFVTLLEDQPLVWEAGISKKLRPSSSQEC